MYNDNQDWVCADCPNPTCQKRDDGGENVIARSVSAREGFMARNGSAFRAGGAVKSSR
jgi:hypothetical protein